MSDTPNKRNALKALDCISRQAAIEAVRRLGFKQTSTVRSILCAIEVVPAAQTERKEGRWISDRLISTNGGTYGVRRCSECEAYYQDVGYGWDYCPNCGAKMKGEQDD